MYNDGYSFTPDSVTNASSPEFWNNFGTIGAGLAVVILILSIFVLALVVFLIIAECKVYKKAGESWWKALIPVYSTWINTKITGLAWWWCPIVLGLSAFSTISNLAYFAGAGFLVVSFSYNYNLAKKFGKTNGFAVLLTILPVIGIPILAFGSAKYDGSIKTDKNGIFAVENNLVK